MLELIEKVSSRPLSEQDKVAVVSGASERDIVYSGLDDTMCNACEETRSAAKEYVCFIPL